MDSIRKTGRNLTLATLIATSVGGLAGCTAAEMEMMVKQAAISAAGAKLESKGHPIGAAAVYGAGNASLAHDAAEIGRTEVNVYSNGNGDLKTYTCVSNGREFIVYRDSDGSFRNVGNRNSMSCERIY